MTATVWWKKGGWTEFHDIGGVEIAGQNTAIIYIIKDNGDTIFVNANEVLYIEEETE